MQSFRTILPPIPGLPPVKPDDHLLCLGSCFAQHIGHRFRTGRWSVDLNPFGILYHPFPMINGLLRLLEEQPFKSDELFYHQDQWHSFAHHGQFSGSDKVEMLAAINQRLANGSAQLKKAKLLLLTFGTANGFVHTGQEQVVANCHKLPGFHFTKQLFSPKDIYKNFTPVLKKITDQFPDLKIILTVSPVRHLRDGLVTNQRSKASLLLACAELEKAFTSVHYFPAYELMMDDLRDYRFYKNDLMHPTEMAIDYIWEYFRKGCFPEETQTYYDEILSINKGLAHRPLRPDSAAHRQFIAQLKIKMVTLEEQYPGLEFGENS